MTRRPNVSQTLALKAAAAAAAVRDDDEQDEAEASLAETAPAHSSEPDETTELVHEPEATALKSVDDVQDPSPKSTGRPKGRRSVAARQTVYLDDARHAALARLAEDRGRSIHSLILEGIDHIIGKPTAKGWQ
jgi:hypothetical protein